MSNNRINEDEKTDLLNRIESLDVLIGDIDQAVEDAAGSLESLRSYVHALEADEKPALFVGAKPKKAFAVGDMTEEGDAALLPLGSRVENYVAQYWEKTGEDGWMNNVGNISPADAIYIACRKILRVGYDEPQRELELGDILFTKEDFGAVPKGHVVVEIVGPENRHFRDGERACDLHYNLFVGDPDDCTPRANAGDFYYLYGGEPVPPADTELPLREAFNAWGANAIVELTRIPGVALTLSPDGSAHYVYGDGVEAIGFRDATVRLVAVLDDGKVIPGEVDRKVTAFKPGDVVRINGGPFHGQRGHVLRVDLDLDNPYLVRADGTTGFGRYEADDLTLLGKSIMLYTVPRDRVKSWSTGRVYAVGLSARLCDVRTFEFLMPKRVPKVGDVIDLKAARRLPVGSRVSISESGVIYWAKASGQRWFLSNGSGGNFPYMSNDAVFRTGVAGRLLRYGYGDL